MGDCFINDRTFHQARCKGWFGVWSDGSVGWMAPRFVIDGGHPAELPAPDKNIKPDDRFVLCDVLVVPRVDARGRLIVRKGSTLGVAQEQPHD